ncbi:hypothetical protein J4E08_10040 [Sagittula sp. NFXS13]|uniref:hypothetical protein n=1 Tax=Sagittula sp. NFXS13 TaxID=2819095 RepID=UPI0032DEBDA0
MQKRRNIYEAIIAWGYDNIDQGVTVTQFDQFCSDWGTFVPQRRLREVFVETFVLRTGQGVATHDTENRDQQLWHLKLDAVFQHLDRVELEEARKSSKSAMWWAITSIVLTGVIGVAQIYVAMCEPQRIGAVSKFTCSE